MTFRFLLVVILLLVMVGEVALAQSSNFAVETGRRIPRQPYTEYHTTDNFGRTITFYLSEAQDLEEPLPLLVYIQGSTTASHFIERGDRVAGNNGHAAVSDAVRGKARLLIVEKPGVNYLDNPPSGSAENASSEFRREHTLERWAEAIHASIEAAQHIPGIIPQKVLVAGHSEGGIVAAKLARDHDFISHVAVLAGGGPSQLYDLLELARSGEFFERISPESKKRVEYVQKAWDRIVAEPEAADSLFFGHSYRRWHSFLSESTMGLLLDSSARVFALQGTADNAVAVSGFDMLCAQLISKGRLPRCWRMEGYDHSFRHVETGQDNWEKVWAEIVDWYLGK